jgi:2-polyprenyl-6-methoxyphenol hydroxylase-like FAD-dependent oxidoreductase
VAVGLRRAGVPIAVYEQAPALLELGAAVGLQAGAINALTSIGLSDELRTIASVPGRHLRVVSNTGKALATWPQFDATVAVHRGDLLDMLKAGVGDESVFNCGRRCVDVRQDATGVTVVFEDGGEERGAVLIGADGLRSAVRKALWGDGDLRYGGYTEWRAMVPGRYGDIVDGSPRYVIGPGGMFGMWACSGERTQWFCKIARPAASPDPIRGRKRDVLETFGSWGEPITALVEATPEDSIDRRDVFDRRPLKAWSRGRATLLGDAAHPTTPSLGAGAGMTIEDAPALARALAIADLSDPYAVRAALRDYERQRIPPTTDIVNASWRFSRVVRARNPVLVAARTFFMPIVPEAYWRRQVEREVYIDLTAPR